MARLFQFCWVNLGLISLERNKSSVKKKRRGREERVEEKERRKRGEREGKERGKRGEREGKERGKRGEREGKERGKRGEREGKERGKRGEREEKERRKRGEREGKERGKRRIYLKSIRISHYFLDEGNQGGKERIEGHTRVRRHELGGAGVGTEQRCGCSRIRHFLCYRLPNGVYQIIKEERRKRKEKEKKTTAEEGRGRILRAKL